MGVIVKRNAMNQLIKWKNENKKHPIILSGIKGVGKTYLALDFAKSFYEGSIYINFETNAAISHAFEQNECSDQSKDFSELISFYYQIPMELFSSILIILDELQYSSSAYLSFLQWVDPIHPLPFILISSEINSFSESICNDFYRICLYPLEFDEFLYASRYEWYVEVITAHSKNNRKIPDIVHKELLDLFNDYIIVGGMPAALNEYFNMESTENIGQIHQNIFNNIQMLNSTKYSDGQSLKMKQIYDTLEMQILKDNPKFQYRPIRKGATYAMFKDAVSDLKSGWQVLMCNKMKGIKDHLIDYNDSVFQLYYFDIGILNYILNKNKNAVLINPVKRHKVIMANYVIQCLYAKGYHAFFWESNSQAKVDVIIHYKDGLIPFDIQINKNTRSKSISVFKEKYDFPYSIKLSDKNFEYTNQTKYIPYYALFSVIDSLYY